MHLRKLLKLECNLRTERINVIGPEVRKRVGQHEERWHNPHQVDEWQSGESWVANHHDLAFSLLLMEAGNLHTVHDPGHDGADKGTVNEVNGERVLSEPEQVLGRQPVLELRGDENREANKVHTESGKKTRARLPHPAQIISKRIELRRPPRPACIRLWVRTQPHSDDHENRRHDATNPFALVNPVEGWLVIRKI